MQPRSPVPTKIALVAGEVSGDVLGADLIEALKRHWPQAEFAGIGGPRMMAAGLRAWWSIDALSVMGLFEVLRHLPRLLGLRKELLAKLDEWRPDIFIGVDAPDFNFRVERLSKEKGALAVHYVSPSLWAWREGRAKKIGRSVDAVLCVFPMETPIYHKHGVAAYFVGHPLAASLPLQDDPRALKKDFGLDPDRPVLAVLPGSRIGELKHLGKIFLDAASIVSDRMPDLQFVSPMASAQCQTYFKSMLDEWNDKAAKPLNVVLAEGQAAQAMTAADVVLLASGTAALEAMLSNKPMVVGYRISTATHWAVKKLKLLKTPWYALPNILAGKRLVPEFMQEGCTPQNLARAVLVYFEATPAALLAEFAHIRQSLRTPEKDAAETIADLLGEHQEKANGRY